MKIIFLALKNVNQNVQYVQKENVIRSFIGQKLKTKNTPSPCKTTGSTLNNPTNQFFWPSIYSGEAPDLSTVKPSLVLDLFTKLTMEND